MISVLLFVLVMLSVDNDTKYQTKVLPILKVRLLGYSQNVSGRFRST